MIKALIKKQLLSFLAFFSIGKNGKKRKIGAFVGFALLMLYSLGASGYMFWLMADGICAPYEQMGLSWAYFALFGVMAGGISLMLTALSTKNIVYDAKDNEALTSMPIPAWAIIFSRVFSLYLLTALECVIILLPAELVYLITVGVEFMQIVSAIVIMLVLPLGVLGVSLLIGWGLAAVTVKLRSKNFATVIFLVVFFVAYFYAYGKINDYLTYISMHGEAVGAAMKRWVYPFYQLGLAATGDGTALLIFTGIFGAVFVLAYTLLSKTFFTMATTKRGGVRAAHKSVRAKSGSLVGSLFKKEFKRYFSNPMVTINCMIGSVMAVLMPLALLTDKDVKTMLTVLPPEQLILIVNVAFAAVAGMNIISSVSIALEGENLWILRSSPISEKVVLGVKLLFHIVFVFPFALTGLLVVAVLAKLPATLVALSVLALCVFVVLSAALGLIVNLKIPGLHWINEVVAVKQGVSTLASMGINLAVVLLGVGGYFAFGKHLPAWAYLSVWTAFCTVACVAVYAWLWKNGQRLWENLT